jgi:hypothetical protein
MIISELFETPQQCPECGGISFSDLILAEKKDACYYKVKASAKVWPSAYASGRLVQCRKKGAANYGNKLEGVAEEQELDEKWSQKYKSSINCSHPKGFSQKAHCAGKKKHNESIEMEMVCEDCGMCETHADHKNLDEACWQGYHKEGNKKMFGKTYPNCVKNEDMAENASQSLTVPQLAAISDEALDNAYHYGRSTPGNTFGYQANLKSAAYAKQMIDQGVTDIEAISDAIHKGWNTTAQAFVQNPDQFDDTAKLAAAGKLEAKLQQRAQLMKQNYAQLPEEEKEKDRVVARALLQAIRGEQGMAEGSLEEVDRRGFLKGMGAAAVAGAAGGEATAQERPKLAVEVGELDVSTKEYESVTGQAKNFIYVYDTSVFIMKYIDHKGNNISEGEIFRARGPGTDFKNRPNTMYFSDKNAVKVVPNGSPDGDLIYFTPRNWIDQKIGWRSVYYQKNLSNIKESVNQGMAEGQPKEKEADYGADYQDMVARVKHLAGLGPLKTVWDPQKRVYKNVPVAVQPKK